MLSWTMDSDLITEIVKMIEGLQGADHFYVQVLLLHLIHSFTHRHIHCTMYIAIDRVCQHYYSLHNFQYVGTSVGTMIEENKIIVIN